jgi:hypothetical protein
MAVPGLVMQSKKLEDLIAVIEFALVRWDTCCLSLLCLTRDKNGTHEHASPSSAFDRWLTAEHERQNIARLLRMLWRGLRLRHVSMSLPEFRVQSSVIILRLQ